MWETLRPSASSCSQHLRVTSTSYTAVQVQPGVLFSLATRNHTCAVIAMILSTPFFVDLVQNSWCAAGTLWVTELTQTVLGPPWATSVPASRHVSPPPTVLPLCSHTLGLRSDF